MKTVEIIEEIGDGEGEIEYHIPFCVTGDPSTLCGIMFDSGKGEGILSWKEKDHNIIDCKQCLQILEQYKDLIPYLKLLKKAKSKK